MSIVRKPVARKAALAAAGTSTLMLGNRLTGGNFCDLRPNPGQLDTVISGPWNPNQKISSPMIVNTRRPDANQHHPVSPGQFFRSREQTHSRNTPHSAAYTPQ